MQQKFIYAFLLVLSSLFASAQTYPYITTQTNPMAKFNFRVGDSLYVSDNIGIGITKKPEARLHVVGLNTSTNDTTALFENSAGENFVYTLNDGTTVIRTGTNMNYRFVPSGAVQIVSDAGSIINWKITGSILTWDYVLHQTSNAGIASSSASPYFNASVAVSNGTTGAGITTNPISIWKAAFTGTVTSITDLYGFYFDISTVSTPGVIYNLYANGGLTKFGTVGNDETLTKIAVLDAQNNLRYRNLDFYTVGGTQNSFFGISSGNTTTTGNSNIGVGYLSLNALTSGQHNQGIGWMSGDEITTAKRNTLIGSQAGGELKVTTADDENTAIGFNALTAADGSQYNTVIGSQSGLTISTGDNNTFLGRLSGSSVTTASGNVFIGYSSGSEETGSNKLYIENSSSATPLIGGDFSTDQIIFGGGIKFKTVAKTANYTATVADFIIYVDATSGAVTITLPAASSTTPGANWKIYKIDASVNTVTVQRAGTDTINGATSKSVMTQYSGIEINGRTSTTWIATALTAL